MMADSLLEQLAGLLHEKQCSDAPACGRWNSTSPGHREHYRDQARNIFTRLEPEIGYANVMGVVAVILDEVFSW